MMISRAGGDLVGLKYSLPSTSKRVSNQADGKALKDLIQDNKCDGADLSNINGIDVSEETFGKIDENKDVLDDQPKLTSNMRELTIVPIAQRIIQDKDADGDGAISLDEMGISQEAFGKLDANEDGLLDQSELESALPEVNEALRAQRMMHHMDTDADGALSVDEMGISEEAFGKLDANEDGLLDQSELESALPELGKIQMAERLIQDKDADGDGALSVDEMGISEEAFAKLDVNEDELLDQSELASGPGELGTILKAETDNEMSQTMGDMPSVDKLQSLNSAFMNSYLQVQSMTQNSENNSNLSAVKNGVNFIA
jgi:Ca2+-binding EF-hand superfamily protein